MLIAVAAMFLQQTCGSVGRVLPAVLAPLIILELHADPAWVGVYFGLTAIAALIGQLGSGGFIIRYGAIRMSQIALVSVGGGMAVAVIGGAAGFVLSALIGNGVAAVATPASSQLLGRWAIRRYAPLAFSITQTAIPAGILLGGWLGPPIAQSLGWRGTMLVSAAACWFFALLLQPLHGRLDTEHTSNHAIRLSDFVTTVTGVLRVHELRGLSFACFAFNGLQAVFIAYFVTYLTTLGYNLVAAGALFSTVIAIAIPCRILWGWVGSSYLAPRRVMSGLAFGMAGSVVLTGAITQTWPVLAIGVVAGVLSATAMSWHGILLSESARLAPVGRAGLVTGGVLSFGQMGAFLCPSVFSLLLRVTGGYVAGWTACAVPAAVVGVILLDRRAGRRQADQPRFGGPADGDQRRPR
ncbi:MAG TPA: MFS transporter [Acetobacteraceae bacterium]|nr:MFS transporter [Acetobacteraceae bacterium]